MSKAPFCLVTGGAGFIGSHLVDRLLEDGQRVRVLDNFSTGRPSNLDHIRKRKELEIVKADIAGDSIGRHFDGADRVFHLAALADIVPSIERPDDYFRANVLGTFNVLEAARAAGVNRLVYSASSSCYGIPDSYPTDERAAIRPMYPYALTKRLGEELVLHWGQIYKIPCASLRLFNVYGPRSRTSGTYGAVFGVFLAQKLAGKPLTVVGDGTQTRDFVFVADVAQAFARAGESRETGEVYNIGAGKPQSVNRLVELLGGPVVHVPKRPGEPDCTHADIRKARERLGFTPKVSFEQGVRVMLDNIEYWRQAPVWEPESIAKATRAWFESLEARG